MLSIIQSEILKRMSPLEKSEDSVYSTSVCFTSDFTGFEGHFPQHPIVPAVCLLSLVELVAKQIADNWTFAVSRIIAMKFRMPILPDEKVSVKASTDFSDNGELLVNAIISKEEDAWAAKIRIALK